MSRLSTSNKAAPISECKDASRNFYLSRSRYALSLSVIRRRRNGSARDAASRLARSAGCGIGVQKTESRRKIDDGTLRNTLAYPRAAARQAYPRKHRSSGVNCLVIESMIDNADRTPCQVMLRCWTSMALVVAKIQGLRYWNVPSVLANALPSDRHCILRVVA